MGEINYTPFTEEEAFTEANITSRFIALSQQGIDDLTATAFRDGCLNENHFPSFVSYAATVEFPADATAAAQQNVLNVNYTSDWDASATAQTGLTYFNASTSSSALMNYPPNDGAWGPIEDGAGNHLKITLPAALDLSAAFDSRFGITDLLVMLNVQVEDFTAYEAGTNNIIASPADADNFGIAVVIQVSPDNSSWYHLYLGDSAYTNGSASGTAPYRYRITERRAEPSGLERDVGGTLNNRLPSRRDIAIRTIINSSSIHNCVNASNVKGTISSIRYIRAAVSIIKCASFYDKKIVARIMKANMTVMALRASEVEPNA